MKNKFIWSVISVAFAAGATALVYAQQQQQQKLIIFDPQQGIYYADANDKSIRALPIRENIFMIAGAGGNAWQPPGLRRDAARRDSASTIKRSVNVERS